mmetsp:Transcript_48769/g.98323  ORF Transcript_48769/g.98323 Transcript_48769/m.98323 type:complete len:214 (+) Transcript_48769:51-692(+)
MLTLKRGSTGRGPPRPPRSTRPAEASSRPSTKRADPACPCPEGPRSRSPSRQSSLQSRPLRRPRGPGRPSPTATLGPRSAPGLASRLRRAPPPPKRGRSSATSRPRRPRRRRSRPRRRSPRRAQTSGRKVFGMPQPVQSPAHGLLVPGRLLVDTACSLHTLDAEGALSALQQRGLGERGLERNIDGLNLQSRRRADNDAQGRHRRGCPILWHL